MRVDGRLVHDVGSSDEARGAALTEAFRRFRGHPPSQFLRERRLQGVRRDLQAALPGQTVAEIAAAWGSINKGDFARHYRARFGEPPSGTLRR